MKRLSCVVASVLLGGCAIVGGSDKAGVRYVDAFDLSACSCGLGKRVQAGKSVDGHVLTLAGKTYAHGFGTHPESAVAFRLKGPVTAFDAYVGIDADYKAVMHYDAPPCVRFRVWTDGRIAWESGDVKIDTKPVAVHVALKDVSEVILETIGGKSWHDFGAMNADWVEARFTCEDGGHVEVLDDEDAYAQWGIQTPPEREEPQINGADIWGVRPGHPVIFRVATSGVRPMSFSAVGLPEGVTLDPVRGILGGVAPKTPGDYDILITATNAKGSATRMIRLAVGETIALTPPMGWNSWNTCCYRLTQEKAMAAARAMDASGLADHGWAYVNLDDWWQMNTSGCKRVTLRQKEFGREDVIGPARDANGDILANRSFPDMKGLTDYIHSFGFKAGLYSSPGPRTCGLCEGSFGHVAQDAARYAAWGFDHLKYDWCSYNEIYKKKTGCMWWDPKCWQNPTWREEAIIPYREMGKALRAQNRDIFYSFCQYGMARVEEWARETGANSWRTGDDLKDQWTWMERSLDTCRGGEFWKYAGPGCWADPDMMIVGEQFSFGLDHSSWLTPNEQYTHVSLWSMVSSPMLLGCDLAKLDAFTRALLVNDEVIAIGQDRLGKPARRVRHTATESVWVRTLANGDLAVALVNRYPLTREIVLDFGEIGAARQNGVRDCWRQQDEGRFVERYSARVPAHATKLLRLKAIRCPRCER